MANSPQASASSSGLSRLAKLYRMAWMLGSVIATVAIVATLLRPHQPPTEAQEHVTRPAAKLARVRPVGQGLIEVDADTPLHKELTTMKIEVESITLPVLSVSGTIVARIHEGTEPIEDRWQFDKPGLSTSYADWLRAKNEIDFAESQLSKTKALADPEKDIRQAKSALLKAQLQGDKDIFSAQSALRVAVKQKAAIERDLSQAGVEPIVFSRAAENMVLVVAYVPEAKVSQAYEDQACEVQFYAFPERTFPGHVEVISSVLTEERRTLRVLFDLTDPEHLLKPGMFAEVGLGTDQRDAVLIPATALMHIGRHDYVLVAAEANQWRVTQVVVGEVQKGRCEVRSGLSAGDTIISRGVTLLMSVASQSLKLPPDAVEKK